MNGKHIAVIHTGGTIGMVQGPNGYAPMPGFADLLARTLAQSGMALPNHTVFPRAQPIDSANAMPRDWLSVAAEIAALYDDYDGFVVLHGTDTMAYTAAALSFMLQGLRKPVILTGSQIPLSEKGSDALDNVADALRFAAAGRLAEVGLCFHHRLLRGNRSSKTSAQSLDAFDSPNYPALAYIENDSIVWNAAALLAQAPAEDFVLPEYGNASVLSLRFSPGLPQRAVDALLDCAPQALILDCYGTGNVPDRDPALLASLRRASDVGVVVIARTQCLHGKAVPGVYAAGAGLGAAGVIAGGDLVFEAAYAKLHHLFACGFEPAQVRAMMLRSLVGEMS